MMNIFSTLTNNAQRMLRVGVTLLPLIGLTACMVGPDYVRPTIDVGVQFKESPGWKLAQPALANAPREPWWLMYRDSTLTQLMQELNVSNQNIALAEARFRQAVAVTQGARAPLLPSVTATGSATRAGAAGSTSGLSASATNNSYGLSAQATWQIDIWGSVRRNIEATDATELALAADVSGARLTAQTALALAYLQVRVLDEQRRLLTATVDAYQRALKLTQNRYNAGISGQGDVSVARTQLESTRAQLIDLEQQRAIFENAVAVLLGRAPSTFAIKAEKVPLVPPMVPVGLPSELLERRPDVAAAERRTAAANAQIGVATAAWFPNLTLNANAGYRSNDFTQWFTAPAQFWALGPQLAALIFDGGARQAQINQTRAQFDAQVAIYRQTVLTALQEVENAMVQMRVFEQEEAVQRLAVQSAQQSLRLARNQYDQGLIDYLSVAVLETTALNNERTYITLVGNRFAASVRLVASLGGGWSAEDLKRLDDSGNPTTQPSKAVPTN
jgi:NodT family efflux transporter outer membrane factor (OMF) lipoprotein|nr:efflux transporter outer membrane subunit [Zwartia hollandica]